MATTYLTQTTTAGSRVQWTWSAWVKRSGLSTDQNIFTGYNAATTYTEVRFDTSDRLNFQNKVSGAWAGELQTTRKFRDTSGWYHIVIVWDTGNGVSGDRVIMYINGVRETVFTGTDIPTLNKDSTIGEASIPTHIGSFATGSNFFDGLISNVCFIDGQALTPTSFGETDATTGEWKIKIIASDGFTWGANGYMILKNGNTITDQSTNSNDFTLGAGTLTNTEDCPDDVFCTFNILDNYYQAGTYSNGNTTFQTNTTNYTYNAGTIGVSKGKFYWEVEYDAKSGGNVEAIIGITSTQPTTTTKALGTYPNDWGYHTQNVTSYYLNNDVYTAYGTAYTEGDIIGVALDADNNKLYFSKNGTWQNSGDPTSGSTGTGALSITAPSSTPLGAYFPSVTFYAGGNNGTFKANFGNGYFGTTVISSAGTNASGIGIFEYDVPTGYTALSTKGLNN